jgi:hypothetical protein
MARESPEVGSAIAWRDILGIYLLPSRVCTDTRYIAGDDWEADGRRRSGANRDGRGGGALNSQMITIETQ